ncbi:MAG TPA: site-specific integrase [Candidatus Eubacterium faecigallinarum]|nr:site-specific integrase [Candidatus Eubacterium faecigallinarum]
MRSDYVKTDTISALLWALQPANSLACKLALETGWRIDDILSLKTDELKKCRMKKRHSLTITESKTGKRSTRVLPLHLIDGLLEQAGRIYVFEGRDDYRKHRTRQAVFADLKRVAKRFNIKINLSPHSLRKNYAVYLKNSGRTLEEIGAAMNHDNITTTIIYALSDELTEKYK